MTSLLEPRTSIRRRLLVGMGVMLLPIVALAVLSYTSSRATLDAFEKISREQERELHPVTQVLRLMLRASAPPRDFLVTGDATERKTFERLCAETDAELRRLSEAGRFNTGEERWWLRQAIEAWDQARYVGRMLLYEPLPEGEGEAGRLLARFDAHLDRASGALTSLYGQVLGEVLDHEQRARAVRRREAGLLVLVSVLSLALAGGAALVLSHSIVGPVRTLQDGILRFAAGDHSFRVALQAGDEFGQLAEIMNRLAERLEHDQLTGVASRSALQRRLRAELPRAQRFVRPFSLLMVDVDHFKGINDVHGHPAGDQALRTIASRIARGLRTIDTVARYGGEEFAVVLPETGAPGAQVVAERLRAAVAAEPIAVSEDVSLPITVSVGVATFPSDAGDDESLLTAADRALYAAKRWGRNRVVAAAAVDATREAEPPAPEPQAEPDPAAGEQGPASA